MVNTKSLFFLLWLIPFFTHAQVTRLSAEVDRNPVMQNEYFALTITANDDTANNALNTSALAKDFIIGRTSVSRSTKIINFDASKETRWQILLAAKQVGTTTIPAFSIDGIQSSPITLEVVADTPNAMHNQDVMLKAKLSKSEPYVDELVTYQVKLYLAKDLQRGVISAPEIKGAQVKQLGEDKDSTEIVNGIRYRVIERVYGITIDTPGKVTLVGAKFNGDIINQNQSTNLFAFNESRPVQASAEDSTLDVLDVPSDFNGQWWVADLAMLSEKWDDQQPFEVGVPITRTFTLVASNAEDYNLPSLNVKAPANVKLYPEKPVRQSILREGRLISQLTQTVAMVPTQPGPLTLPAISIPWWNPQLTRVEYATLPERQIDVAPSAMATSTPSALSSNLGNSSSNAINSTDGDESVSVNSALTQLNNSSLWPWLSLGFAILWLITLWAWWRARKTSFNAAPAHLTHSQMAPTQANEQALKRACEQQAIGTIMTLVPSVCSDKLGVNLSLVELAGYAPAVAATLAQLQRHAYGQEENHDSAALCSQLLKEIKQLAPANLQRSELSALNP